MRRLIAHIVLAAKEPLAQQLGIGVMMRMLPASINVVIGLCLARLLVPVDLARAYALHAMAGLVAVSSCGWLYHVALRESSMPHWLPQNRHVVIRGYMVASVAAMVILIPTHKLVLEPSAANWLLFAIAVIAIGLGEFYVALFRGIGGIALAAKYSIFRATLALGIAVLIALLGRGKWALVGGYSFASILAVIMLRTLASRHGALNEVAPAGQERRPAGTSRVLGTWLAFGIPAAATQLMVLATDGGIRIALAGIAAPASAAAYGLASDMVTLVVWGIGSTLVVVLIPSIRMAADTIVIADTASRFIQSVCIFVAGGMIVVAPVLSGLVAPEPLRAPLAVTLVWVSVGVGLMAVRHWGIEFVHYTRGLTGRSVPGALVACATALAALSTGWFASVPGGAGMALTVGAIAGVVVATITSGSRGAWAVWWRSGCLIALGTLGAFVDSPLRELASLALIAVMVYDGMRRYAELRQELQVSLR